MYQVPTNCDYGVNTCAGCLKKQQQINRLTEEVARLKALLRYRERQQQAGCALLRCRPPITARSVVSG